MKITSLRKRLLISIRRMFVRKIILFMFVFGMASFLEARPGFYEPWGKHADLKIPSKGEEEPKSSPLAWAGEKIIWFHQNIISPVDGPRSHFRPSSSEYMRLAMRKYGFFKGYVKGCDRLLRENSDPWIYRKTESDGKLFKWDPPK